jgi:hypothetical protein
LVVAILVLGNIRMKKREVWIGVLIFVAWAGAAIAFGVGDIYVSGSWRYKMTVIVETPEGIKTGSAVREVSNTASSLELDWPNATNRAELKGEAVVVDLGERGALFALLCYDRGIEDHARRIVYDVFPYSGGYSTVEGIRHYRNLKHREATLTQAQYPLLVTFKDLDDPKTVTRVLDMEWHGPTTNAMFSIKADHFEELFGKGVRLKEITIEMTDEPVTWEIDKYLSWLHELAGGYLHGGFTSRGAPLGLYGGNFQSGKNNR